MHNFTQKFSGKSLDAEVAEDIKSFAAAEDTECDIECSICHDTESGIRKTLECGHGFHKECIKIRASKALECLLLRNKECIKTWDPRFLNCPLCGKELSFIETVELGSLEVIQRLLFDEGWQYLLRLMDKFDSSGLMKEASIAKVAMERGDQEILNLLETIPEDINYAEALCEASKRGLMSIVSYLLDGFASAEAVNAVNSKDGSTPLLLASRSGHVEVVNALLANGANVNTPLKIGWTPLHCTSAMGHIQVVEALLNNGATESVNSANNDGMHLY
jgi:hypothetical protein